MNESSVRAGLLFLVGVPVCLIAATIIIYDISYAVTGQYSFTFSRECVGWQTGDGAVIVWIPTYVIGLFLEIFPLIILVRAYLLRSSHKGLNLLKDPEILTIADDAAVTAGIELPPLYVLNDHRPLLDVLGTNKNPFLRVSNTFIDSFRKKPEELKALLLHEYSHILNKDMGLLTLRTNFIHVLGWYLLIGFGYQCYNGYMYAATYSEIPPSEMGTRVLFRIFGDEVSLFLGIVLLYLLVTSIYREREFLADKKAFAMMKDSTLLISGLTRLRMMIPKGLHIEILSDHPSLQKRIDALKRKRTFSTVLFWTALTLAFCTLVISESFTSLALLFFRYSMFASQRFYESGGVWIFFCIDVVFPIVIFLYLFRIEPALKSLKSLMYSVGKGCLFCGLYTALRVGYYLLARILSTKGYNFLDIAHLSVNARYFEWAYILWFDILQDKAIILLRFIRMLDMPLWPKSALELWIIAFLVMVVCLFLGIGISAVRKVKRVASLPRRTRLFLVIVLEILLISGCTITQLPRENKSTAVEEWVMSFYEAYDYRDPHSQRIVRAGSFNFDTQYDIADNFYGIRILNRISGLGNLTLTQRDELIRWLKFHQDNGDFFMEFYFFKLDDKASIWEEHAILMSLQDLDALDVIDREGAIQYALSDREDDPWQIFFVIQTLFVVDAVERLDEQTKSLAEKYFLNFDYEPNPNFPGLCHEGFHFCWEMGWECILCTYWGIFTLEDLNMLDQCNKMDITDWIAFHQSEDGGFCKELLIEYFSDPPEMCQGDSDLESTFYAVESLETLNTLDAIDREKTISYVLSCQTRKGGFASTPHGEPTFEDTYYAVEVLDSLGALDQLTKSFESSDLLEEIFHDLPLVFYICMGALIAVDLFLYYRVWK